MRCLHTLKVYEFRTPDLVKVFRNCPLLEEVEVYISDTVDVNLSSPTEGVIMPYLNRLHLSYKTDPTAMLDMLTTPKLTDFSTYWSLPDIPWPEARFMEFLRRSQASLRNIYIMDSSPNQWRMLFDAAPQLIEVQLNEDVMTLMEIFDRLTIRADGAITFPNLETIVVVGHEDHICAEELYTMIQSRANVCPLSTVALDFYGEVIPNFKDGPLGALWREAGRLGYDMEVRDDDRVILDIQEKIDASNEPASNDE